MEAGGQVVAVEEDALWGGNRAKMGASSATDAGVSFDGLAEWAELLGVVAVGAESRVGRLGKGIRKGVGR